MKSGSYKSGIKKASSFIQHYDALYPSPNLYTKNLKLKIQNGENITYIKLPNFILRQKGNVFDEFQINTNVATVIRRIKLNYDGTTSVLNNPVIEKSPA